MPNALAPMFMTALVVVVIGLVVAAVRHERRRRAAWVQAARDLGFSVDPAPSTGAKAAAFEGLEHLAKTLRGGARNITTVLTAPPDAPPLRLLIHRYRVDKVIVIHTLVVMPAPPGWPAMTLRGEHLGHRIAAFLGSRDMQLEDPAFNARIRIRTDDETFALLALTPEVQAFLLEGPKNEQWIFGNGRLCFLRSGQVRAEELAPIVRRTLALRDALPRELDDYAPGP